MVVENKTELDNLETFQQLGIVVTGLVAKYLTPKNDRSELGGPDRPSLREVSRDNRPANDNDADLD